MRGGGGKNEIDGEEPSISKGITSGIKGIFTKGIGGIVKAVKEHPVISGVAVAGTAAALAFVPVIGWAALGAGAVVGGAKAIGGGAKDIGEAVEAYKEGDSKAFYENCEEIGGDAFNLALSVSGAGASVKGLKSAISTAKATGTIFNNPLAKNAAAPVQEAAASTDDAANMTNGTSSIDDSANLTSTTSSVDDILNSGKTAEEKINELVNLPESPERIKAVNTLRQELSNTAQAQKQAQIDTLLNSREKVLKAWDEAELYGKIGRKAAAQYNGKLTSVEALRHENETISIKLQNLGYKFPAEQ